jgi:hypothetical protein
VPTPRELGGVQAVAQVQRRRPGLEHPQVGDGVLDPVLAADDDADAVADGGPGGQQALGERA